MMLAPMSGSPLNSPSITVPVMVRSCATAERMAKGTINKNIKDLFIFIIYFIIFFNFNPNLKPNFNNSSLNRGVGGVFLSP